MIVPMAKVRIVGPRDRLSDTLRVVELQALMNGAREMHIRHDGKIYVLRLTSNGKLLLTK